MGCFLFTQCLESSYQSSDNRLKILRAISSDVVLAHYEEFTVLSDALAQETAALCADLTVERLESARQAWWDARGRWKRAEVVTFGPVVEYPARLGPRIDHWPVKSDAVEELIESDESLSPEEFQRRGTATRGLPVVEYLLWGEGDLMSTLAALSDDPRRCAALASTSVDIHTNATQLASAWRDEWIDLVNPTGGEEEGKFENEQEVIVEWVNRLSFTVENVRVVKFEKPLGDLSPEDVRPDIIESRSSGRSIEDARDALRGVIDVWRGTGEEGQLNGLKFLIVDRRVVNLIDGLFDEATTALDLLEDPLELLTTDHRAELDQAINALKALQSGLQTELAESTQATIRFNDTTDGD